jgi:NTE family protein
MKRRDFLAAAAGAALAAGAVAREAGAGQRGAARVALALGGGGCRGYSHIGVLRVLEREGLRPGLVVGSSAGSFVGALWAAGVGAERLERLGARLRPNMLRDWVLPHLGLFSGAGIARFVRAQIGERAIESLPVRFAAVATDLRTGAMVVLDRGEVGLAVQASASAPGLLEPVALDGRLLVDGNLSAPVPVAAARRLGGARVVSVDVTFPPEQADLDDPYDALYQGFSILTRRLALEERAQADVMIEPAIAPHRDMSRATIAEHIEAGERAAEAALAKLRSLFGRSS